VSNGAYAGDVPQSGCKAGVLKGDRLAAPLEDNMRGERHEIRLQASD